MKDMLKLAGLLMLALASVAVAADVEDQMSLYGSDNAIGYLNPLIQGIGADLNGGLYSSAKIPLLGFYVSLEVEVIGVTFGSDDRTFKATTEGAFSPEQTVDAPTVVGPGTAVVVEGDGGTAYVFPGGFNLSSFALAVPQVRFGSVLGTEALVRYFAVDVGDNELGDFRLFGFGLRHSVSQYFELPVEIAGGFFWQRFRLGKSTSGADLISGSTFTVGIQASRRFGSWFAYVEPYGGLSIDRFSMEASYVGGDDLSIDLDFGTTSTAKLTLGVTGRLGPVRGHIDYSVAKQNTIAIGLGLGM